MAGTLSPVQPGRLLKFSAGRSLPMIFQTEATECGLACLAMIAGYYGYKTDMGSLRSRFAQSSHGLTLKHLMDTASKMHLASRALRLELDALPQLQMPCILHWDMNHFVVLKSIKRKQATVYDPAVGRRVYRLSELADHVTGIALEVSPTDEFEPGEARRVLRIGQLWSRIVGIHSSLFSVLLLSLLLQCFAVISPFFMQTVVDDVLLRSDDNLLQVLALGFGLLLLIEAGISALRQLVILNLSSRLNIQMAANVFRHLIRLPMAYFQKRHLGDILSRFGSLDNIRQLISTGLVAAVVDGIMALITLTVMFVYDVQLTFVVLAVVLVYAVIRCLLYAPLKRLTEESLVAAARTETSFMESIRAIQTIKLHQKENDRQNQWQNKLADTMNKGIQLAKLNISYDTTNLLLFGLGNIVVIYLAANAVMENVMTLGMLYAFMSFKQRFVGAMDNLIEQAIQIKMLSVHLERLADIVFTQKEYSIDCDEGAAPCVEHSAESPPSERLTVTGLAYRYSEAEAPVFSQLNMTVEPGECVAITGVSGSGKTTLLKCLMGLLQPSAGKIAWGDKPLSQVPHYRRLIAGVMQDDQLLGGSIADNIACFDDQLDLERIGYCAQLACIHEDIMALPMQYNTLVGDMGAGLSGGQKQRIILARALYRKPAILFMDEATSHLDSNNEKKVSQNIAKLAITRIIVAHRAETIRAADRVIELVQ